MKIRIFIVLIALCMCPILAQDDIVITPMPGTLKTKTIIPAPKSNDLGLALTHTPSPKENYDDSNLDKLAKLLSLPHNGLKDLTKAEVEKQIREKFTRPNITKIQTADRDSDIIKRKTEIENLVNTIFGSRSTGVEEDGRQEGSSADIEQNIKNVIKQFGDNQIALFSKKDREISSIEIDELLNVIKKELAKYTPKKQTIINYGEKLNYWLINIYNSISTAHLFNEIRDAAHSQNLQQEIPYLLGDLEDEKKDAQKYYKGIEPQLKEYNLKYASLLLKGIMQEKLKLLDIIFLPMIEKLKSTPQIQKNIPYIFSNLADADSGEFVSKEAAKAINEAAQALVKAAGSDAALKNIAMNVSTIASNILKDIKTIDEMMPKYLGKKASLKRKFLNLFKKEEEKQPLVSSKDKNKAGRTIMDARESLQKQPSALLAERNKAAGMQTKQVAQLIIQLCNKLEELVNTVVGDEEVKGANDKN